MNKVSILLICGVFLCSALPVAAQDWRAQAKERAMQYQSNPHQERLDDTGDYYGQGEGEGGERPILYDRETIESSEVYERRTKQDAILRKKIKQKASQMPPDKRRKFLEKHRDILESAPVNDEMNPGDAVDIEGAPEEYNDTVQELWRN